MKKYLKMLHILYEVNIICKYYYIYTLYEETFENVGFQISANCIINEELKNIEKKSFIRGII